LAYLLIVAIDGPAGSGKSTVAKAVAVRLGMRYLDTGAMYRAVAWKALESNVALDDEPAMTELARRIDIVFEHTADSPLPTRVLADGTDVTTNIRRPEVDAAVSAAARVPGVRAAMVPLQRVIGAEHDLVAEGRDMGTVVFPDAELKVFLTASVNERARRRHLELVDRGIDIELGAVHSGIESRDDADSTREASPLSQAPDARLVDTTGLSVDEVVDTIAQMVPDQR
jgi:cytidylate kinase